jgi:phospholipase A1
MYLLMGSPETKIQLSFKVKLVDGMNLYFGYSQLMMWELFRLDPYFRDVNYNPEFFFRIPIKNSKSQFVDFGPIEHESNGRGGIDERSWNRTYARYHFEKPVGGPSYFIFSLKAWQSFIYNASNTDVDRYRGIWELELSFANFFEQSYELTPRLYPGGPSTTDPSAGSQELTLRYALPKIKLLTYFTAQLIHGYGKNLLNYKDEQWGIRGGIGF